MDVLTIQQVYIRFCMVEVTFRSIPNEEIQTKNMFSQKFMTNSKASFRAVSGE